MKHFLRILLIIGVFLVTFIAAVFGALTIVMKGPSVKAAELMTMSLRETSALYWIPNLYFSDERIQEIVANNTVKIVDEETDTSLVDTAGSEETEREDIDIYEISGSTYIGDVMLIRDPSRVFIGNKGTYDGSAGDTVDHIAERYGAVAGINGGGFDDPNGMGNGGTPDGFVISEGEFVYGSLNTPYSAIGFTQDNIMVLGYMTGQEALDMGLRDCVCVRTTYAPTLIQNGTLIYDWS